MNGLISWWARNSVAANLLMIFIIGAGIYSFISLGREVFPSSKIDIVEISVVYPGASPAEVEEQIILRVEEAVSDLDNIDEIQARAFEGFANIDIEMKKGADFTEFLNEIKSRVDGISTFPDSAYPPVVAREYFGNNIIWISLSSNELSEKQLAALARDYRDELAALPGGSPLVDLQGIRREEVSIEISEESLRRYNLTFDEVARAIRGASINGSSGTIRTDTGDVQLAVRQLADNQTEFERIIIRRNPDGSSLRVGDVATVNDGFVEDYSVGKVNGMESITLVVSSGENPNVVSTSTVVEKWIAEKQEALPDGVELKLLFDFSEAYKERMALVSSNAGLGLVLVIIVLVLFLRPVVAVWVSIGIATAFVGAFIFMPMVDITLNMISLFGLLLVIGIVVDDALIVGESIHRQVEHGRTGLDAALVGTQIVVKPVIFAVLTTMIAFMPFLFMSGGVSDFLKHVTWTVILALTFSLIEAFLILPAHLAHMKHNEEPGAFSRFQQKIADSLIWVANNIYRPVISACLKFRYFTAAAFLGAWIIAFNLMGQGWVAFDFMPKVESPFINLNITMREGTPNSRTRQVYEKVELAMDDLREELNEEFGHEMVRYYSSYANNTNVYANFTLLDFRGREITSADVAERLRALIGDIPDAEAIQTNTSFNDGGADVVVGLEAENTEQMRAASAEIQAYLRSIGGVYDVRDRLQSATDEIRVSLKPGAERFGLNLGEVSRQVSQAYYGLEVQRLPREGDDVRVMLRLPREVRENVDSLNNYRIRTNDGREVPLASIVDITYAPSFRRIDRIDRKRSTMITADVAEGQDANLIQQQFYREFAPTMKLRYPDVNLKERGNREEQMTFMTELVIYYGAALIIMYMLIAIGFSSYFQPILIMSAIPFAFMGSVLGHLLLGEPMAMFSFFGIAAAGGVVINDNLVLVDYVNRLRKEGAGAMAALIEAGTTRFRPILLTSITTFIGLVPILLEDSINAKFLAPLIISMAFGVLFALFVTLLFVPSLYGIGVDIARFYRGLWTGEPQPPLGQGDSLTHEIPNIDHYENLEVHEGTPQPGGNLKPAE